jgi:hypothetical protein
MADYVTDGKIGIDLTATYASNLRRLYYAMFPVTPGTRVNTSNNGVYIFVSRRVRPLTHYDAVIMSTYADSASTTPVMRCCACHHDKRCGFGFQHGWLCTKRYCLFLLWLDWLEWRMLKVNLLVACNPKVPLYTTATAGKLDDTTVSAGLHPRYRG